MTTGASLTGSDRVRKLQTILHAQAKEAPDRRCHALIDKVWREDFLAEAWRRVRRNGGSAGVDGETFAGSEGRDPRAEIGAAGADPEETTRKVPAIGHPLHTGQGGADIGPARA